MAALICSCPHLQALGGLPPQPIGRELMLMPHFLSSAAWDQLHPVERKRDIIWERDRPLSLPCSSTHPCTTGIWVQIQRAPSPCCIPDSPSGPTTSPNLLFSSSLQRGPFVVIIFFFLI